MKLFDLVKTIPIVDVVEKIANVKLKQSGNSMLGLCPLHNEKSPSFSVLPDKGTFNCFGCGKKGDIVNFVSYYKGYENQKTAAIEIAKAFGLEIDEEKFDEAYGNKKAMVICNTAAQKYYTESLLSLKGEVGAEIKGYVAKRLNLPNKSKILDTINEFGIGWCNGIGKPEWIESVAAQCGLVNNDYQTFKNRIVVPIKNKQGQVCGFGGRVLPQLQTDKTPKYLNSKENSLFEKQGLLFGLFESMAKVKDKQTWILTESYFDVINMHARNVKAAVANMGTAITEKQIDLLLNTQKVSAVLIIAHNDKNMAGLRSAITSYELLSAKGVKVQIVLPIDPYKDLGDIFEAQQIGFDQIGNYVQQIDYQDALCKTGLSKEDGIKNSLGIAKKIKSPLFQDAYLEDLSIKTGVNKSTLKAEMSYL